MDPVFEFAMRWSAVAALLLWAAHIEMQKPPEEG